MSITHLNNTLQEYDKKNLTRKRFIIESRDDIHLDVSGKSVVNFCSNDYLNIANHPEVKTAFIQGIEKYGVGSGASSLISGYFKATSLFEEAFSEFINRERSLFFNSGYHANLGVMTVLAGRKSTVIADKLCHASLIDGIILSRAKHRRYRHNDIEHAEKILKNTENQHNILLSESVFSMQGTIANIPGLVKLAKEYQATLIIDDAHGVGVLGQNGKGIVEHYQLNQNDIPCLVTPLGKSFASMGAIVSGSHDLIEALIQFARTYCFTTALPPAINQANLASLKIIQSENWRREKLTHLSKFFNAAAKERSLPLVSNDLTPIKSIMIGSNKITIEIQDQLLKKGFFVSCIRPPTVPVNTSRIRVSLSCLHTEEHITQLLDELYKMKPYE